MMAKVDVFGSNRTLNDSGKSSSELMPVRKGGDVERRRKLDEFALALGPNATILMAFKKDDSELILEDQTLNRPRLRSFGTDASLKCGDVVRPRKCRRVSEVFWIKDS